MHAKGPVAQPSSLLVGLYGDVDMSEIFSLRATIQAWLAVEVALARAQAVTGDLAADDAEAIADSFTVDNIDMDQLFEHSRDVGYPILPLVRQLAAKLPDGPNGRVHYGATTQDVMDTALALQLRDASRLLQQRMEALGDALVALTTQHASTAQAARTHGQQAVPTTFGAKLAVFLDQTSHRLVECQQVGAKVAAVSLSGAGGTSAAFGPNAGAVRAEMARQLGLNDAPQSWHVNRDRILAFGNLCAGVASLTVRLAREVIDLSRTEIAEVREPGGHHAGASSTMPQKVNPVMSEATIGFGVVASALLPALYRASEASHERAAGEWQIEWHIVPQLAVLASSAAALMTDVVRGLQVFPETMLKNMSHDHGLLMAEAYMIQLADTLGREVAHDVVYEAVSISRQDLLPLEDVLRRLPAVGGIRLDTVYPSAYLGDATDTARLTAQRWRTTRKATS